jgi:hypothetical protein
MMHTPTLPLLYPYLENQVREWAFTQLTATPTPTFLWGVGWW